jgi:Transglycosylase SLT domain.
MPKLSDQQIALYAYRAGFRNKAGAQDLTLAVAIALAESDGDPSVTHKNSDSRGTTDLGTWQINNYWHRDLLAKYNWSDPQANADMAYIIKTQRGGWSQWSTFNSGRFFKYMPRAMNAAAAVTGGQVPTMPGDTSTSTANMDSDSSGISSLTSGHTWLRVAMILSGSVLLLVALAMLGWEGAPEGAKTLAKTAAKTAVKAAVVA